MKKFDRESALSLGKFLCKAAGVDHLSVRSITCTVDFDRGVLPVFEVETLGEKSHIEAALGKNSDAALDADSPASIDSPC
jgi:hypothetical protein